MVVSKALIKYIKEHLEEGHSVDTIKLQLVKHGHNFSDVEDAIEAAQKKTKAKSHFPTFWVLLVIVLTMIVVLFFVLAKVWAPEAPVVTPEMPEVPSEVTPEMPPTKPSEIPETPPTIPETPEIPPEVPPTTAPITPEPTPVVPEIKVPELSFNITPRIEFIRDRSLTDPTVAIALCADFYLPDEKDLCFLTISKSIPDSSLCGRILDENLKDQCYFSFAPMGVDTCENIVDKQSRQACSQLISLNLTLP